MPMHPDNLAGMEYGDTFRLDAISRIHTSGIDGRFVYFVYLRGIALFSPRLKGNKKVRTI